jgi:hypothetical protein
MPWGEKIAQFVGDRQDRRSKERDAMWAKLMQVAGMGSDIWKTLSGRKFTTNERLGAEKFSGEQAGLGRTQAVEMQEDAQLHGTGERLGAEKFSAAQNDADRATRIKEAMAGKKSGEGELNRRLNEALASVTTLNPDFVIPDPNNPTNSILDLTKARDIKDAVLAFFEDPAEREWAAKQIDLTIARWKPKEQGNPKVTQTPTFNPPDVKPPTKPPLADINLIAKKLVDARRAAGQDANAKSLLDYIQGQLPRPGNPLGGFDYSKNPIEWAAKAMETINKILGIAVPSTGLERTYEVNPGARKR